MDRLSSILLSAALTLLSSQTLAHHSASKDADKGEQILWRGTLRQVSFDGAHVMYRIEVRDADGGAQSWQVLGASPRILAKRGIRKSTLSAGTSVTVAGFLNPFNKLVSPMYIAHGTERYYVGYFLPDGTFIGR
jgi:hypothetical protein